LFPFLISFFSNVVATFSLINGKERGNFSNEKEGKGKEKDGTGRDGIARERGLRDVHRSGFSGRWIGRLAIAPTPLPSLGKQK